MSEPKLSVCMSNFNHARYLPRAIEGIISQSRPPDEFIIIDDASTDDSVEVIQPYADKCDYIHFYRNATNRGALDTLSRALSSATGDWYYGASADDLVLPRAFEAVMELAADNPDVGIIFGPMLIVDAEGNETGLIESSRWHESFGASPEDFLREYLEVELPEHSQGASTIYRRQALVEAGGFRPELGHWTDTFALRAIGLRHGVGYVREPISAWTKLPDSTSGASLRDPHLMLDIIARAAWLMRSHEFSTWFPADYVEQWEKSARAMVIERQGPAVQNNMRAQMEHVAGGPPSPPLRWLTDAALKVVASVACRGLRRYEGDISCYDSRV